MLLVLIFSLHGAFAWKSGNNVFLFLLPDSPVFLPHHWHVWEFLSLGLETPWYKHITVCAHFCCVCLLSDSSTLCGKHLRLRDWFFTFIIQHPWRALYISTSSVNVVSWIKRVRKCMWLERGEDANWKLCTDCVEILWGLQIVSVLNAQKHWLSMFVIFCVAASAQSVFPEDSCFAWHCNVFFKDYQDWHMISTLKKCGMEMAT